MRMIMALGLLCLAGCACENDVVDYAVTLGSDGGAVAIATEHCAQGCDVTADCPADYYCSAVANRSSGPAGLCFQNGH